MIARDRLKNVSHGLDVRAIGNAYFNLQSSIGIPQDPVDHAARHQFRIRNQYILVVECFDFCGPDADAADKALYLADRYEITGTNRAFEQQNEAGDEIIRDFLHAEADTESEGAGNKC